MFKWHTETTHLKGHTIKNYYCKPLKNKDLELRIEWEYHEEGKPVEYVADFNYSYLGSKEIEKTFMGTDVELLKKKLEKSLLKFVEKENKATKKEYEEMLYKLK